MNTNVAVWTMVRNEDYFLRLWVSYYAQFVPRENMFILLDGADSTLPDGLEGCQIVTFPKGDVGPGWDKKRWDFLSQFASALTTRFDLVVGGDVDELIVLDPQIGDDPIAHILADTTAPVISPFAIELVHRIDQEHPLDQNHPVLAQRAFGRINMWYSKPCIIRAPIRWSLGQHFSTHPELHLSRDLYLFHLRFVDHDMLVRRQKLRMAHVSNTDGAVMRGVAGVGWQQEASEISDFLHSFVAHGPPFETSFGFGPLRKRMQREWGKGRGGFGKHACVHRMTTYRIPDRFRTVF
jgi:hypothetical protein